MFLQVARGERPVDHLSLVHIPRTQMPPASVEVSIAPLPLEEVSIAPLPLEIVPPPAPLPAGSRMPLRRNPLFVGRDTDLRRIARVLTISGTAAIGQVEIVAATGLGGIGKTQLACEFVHRYGPFFAGGIFWLSFADPTAIPAEVAACGGGEGMQLSSAFGTLPLDEQVQRVLTAWREPIPRLLVFDNCEDETLLEQWRPAHGGCRVLLTSRHQHWDVSLGVQIVPLDVLARDKSLELLRQFRPELPADDPDLHAIAEVLGDLPLALHLAGSFLANYRHALTPAQYLQRLHAPTILDDRSLQAAGLSPTKHVQHVARTFEQSYAQLDPAEPTDALARPLLAHAACCAPGEAIPRWFLLHTLEVPVDAAERNLTAEDAFTRLIDLGLLDTDVAGMLRMHRLVVAFVQTVLGQAAAQVAVETTILRVVEDLNEKRNPRPVLAVQPHLRFITEVAQQRTDARAAALCHALGEHLRHLGAYVEALRYLEQALTIRQRVLGPDHPDTALSLNSVGAALEHQGQYAEALRYLEQAFAIRQRVLGPDHPDTALSLNNLGAVLEDQGQYAAAQRYYEQALAIQERVLGADHPHTAVSLHNLGMVFHAQKQYAAAQRYYEQALAIQERVLGADHPHTAVSLTYLGNLRSDQGRYAEAQGYLEQALAIQERVLGADHPATARSLCSLGEVLHAQGETARARDDLERALAIFERVLRAGHPDIAMTLHTLGLVLHTQGQDAAMRRCLGQALTIYEQALGPGHPNTQRVRASLAALVEYHSKM